MGVLAPRLRTLDGVIHNTPFICQKIVQIVLVLESLYLCYIGLMPSFGTLRQLFRLPLFSTKNCVYCGGKGVFLIFVIVES